MNIVTPILIIHICAAVVGLLSGALAMLFRKGAGFHRAAGTVFFVSMLIMSSTATYLALKKPAMISFVVGLLVFYLVSTAWMAAKRGDGERSALDLAAMLIALTSGISGYAIGSREGEAIYFIFGTIALLFVVSDVRTYLRGGAAGATRIGRHLWRMSLALILATLSLYPGNARLFAHRSGLYYLPLLFFVVMTLYWLIRVRRPRRTLPA